MLLLHIRLTLNFINDITYSIEFNALLEGKDYRIIRLLNIILLKLIKCKFFPFKLVIPILLKTQKIYYTIIKLQLIP